MPPHRMRRYRTVPQRRSYRRRLWITSTADTASVTTGQTNAISLYPGFGQGATDAGFTFVKSIINLVPSTTPALGDFVQVGIVKGRNSDLGVNIANGMSVAQVDQPWLFLYKYVENSGLSPGGGNGISIRAHGLRRISNAQEEMLLCYTSGFTAALVFHTFIRTLVLLP